MRLHVAIIALGVLMLFPAATVAQAPSTLRWTGPSAGTRAPLDSREHPHAGSSWSELGSAEGRAWEQIGIGVGILVGGVAVGVGGGVGLGLASQRYGTVERCFSFGSLGTRCSSSPGVTGHDSGLLGGSIILGAIGLVAILVGGFGFIMPGAQARRGIARERRSRGGDHGLSLEVTSDGALATLDLRF